MNANSFLRKIRFFNHHPVSLIRRTFATNQIKNFTTDTRCLNLPNFSESSQPSLESFRSSIDDNKKLRLMKICKNREERPVRQKILYDTYVGNTQRSLSGDKILLSDLCQKYKITSSNIMSWTYYHGSNRYKTSNPFGLPDSRIVASIVFDPKSGDTWHNAYEKLMTKYMSEISDDQSYGLERMLIRDDRYIILRNGNNYDYAELEITHDKKSEDISSNDTPQMERELVAINNIIFIEKKRPARHFDSFTLEGVLKMAKDRNNYVNKIGHVGIFNAFDDSHIYHTTFYDKVNGQDSFDTAIINSIDCFFETKGDASIRYQKTRDIISQTVKNICVDDVDMQLKICDDFVNNTTHSSGDTHVEIGKLMDQYNIESHELLYVMYTVNFPFGAGIFENILNKEKVGSFTLESAKQTLESHNYHVDYLHGRPIKNSFREKQGDSQNIRIHKYDSRTQTGHFYRCIMWLMGLKLTQKTLLNTLT